MLVSGVCFSLCCLLLVVFSLSSMSVFYQGVFCLVLHVGWILAPVIVYSTLDAVPYDTYYWISVTEDWYCSMVMLSAATGLSGLLGISTAWLLVLHFELVYYVFDLSLILPQVLLVCSLVYAAIVSGLFCQGYCVGCQAGLEEVGCRCYVVAALSVWLE